MIKVKFTGRKKLKFHVQVWGTNLAALRGVFVIMDGDGGDSGVEYRFEGKLENDTISFLLPPLNKVIARPVANDTVMRTYLEVMGEGLYNIPWKDEILIKVREAHIENVEQGEDNIERETTKETKQSVLEIEDEGEDKVEGEDDDGNDSVDESTEDKIHTIISQMRKFNAVKEVEKVVKPVRPLVEEKKEKVKEKKEEVKEEKVEEKKEEVLEESVKEEPEVVVPKKDKKRHEKKVMASLLSVANQ